MKTLREAGLQKIREGMTSVIEVLKNTVITKEALPAYLINLILKVMRMVILLSMKGTRTKISLSLCRAH
jgi:hypothetical protein